MTQVLIVDASRVLMTMKKRDGGSPGILIVLWRNLLDFEGRFTEFSA
jgi:hypothetical protein